MSLKEDKRLQLKSMRDMTNIWKREKKNNINTTSSVLWTSHGTGV
jgi:hypothetical protein